MQSLLPLYAAFSGSFPIEPPDSFFDQDDLPPGFQQCKLLWMLRDWESDPLWTIRTLVLNYQSGCNILVPDLCKIQALYCF